jgi:hypothetical protein
MDSEPVRVRHFHGYELHVAVHEIGDKGDIARETVQPGNEKHGAAVAAFGKSRKQLGPVRMLLAALDFDKLHVNHWFRS